MVVEVKKHFVVTLVVALMCTLAMSCRSRAPFGCEDAELTKVLAPDGRYSVAAIGRDCGATTSSALHISLLKPKETPPVDGNIVVIDCKTCDVRDVRVMWESPVSIVVFHPPGARLHHERTEVAGVKVTYRSEAVAKD